MDTLFYMKDRALEAGVSTKAILAVLEAVLYRRIDQVEGAKLLEGLWREQLDLGSQKDNTERRAR